MYCTDLTYKKLSHLNLPEQLYKSTDTVYKVMVNMLTADILELRKLADLADTKQAIKETFQNGRVNLANSR